MARMKNLIALVLLMAASLNAQCWLPLGTPGLFNDAFNVCHAQAIPGNPTWTHRFDLTALTPQQKALVKAMAMVEQGLSSPSEINPGEANVVGDNGAAHGPLQIHKACFIDARQFMPQLAPSDEAYPRHVEWSCWEEDLSEPERMLYRSLWWANSVGVWYAYCMRYSPMSMGLMDAQSCEIIARRWNGGIHGEDNNATEAYWQKTREKLLEHYPGVIPGI